MPKKIIKGVVTSTKMNKTAVVTVELFENHPVYKKRVKKYRKFKARDDIGVNTGDLVVIEETVPHSKTVTWKIIEKVEEKKGK